MPKKHGGITATDLDLLALIGERRVTLNDLIAQGACRDFDCLPESLRSRLSKLADAGLLRKVKVPAERRAYAGRQFGLPTVSVAYEKIREDD